MANWARLQEQLTGLPVVKRAKHSIHFDKGNGDPARYIFRFTDYRERQA